MDSLAALRRSTHGESVQDPFAPVRFWLCCLDVFSYFFLYDYWFNNDLIYVRHEGLTKSLFPLADFVNSGKFYEPIICLVLRNLVIVWHGPLYMILAGTSAREMVDSRSGGFGTDAKV